MMSKREKKSLILMLRMIDEMYECKDTPETGAGATCTSNRKNTMVAALLAMQQSANLLLDNSTDVCLGSHESMKSMLAEGDSTKTTSQHETIQVTQMSWISSRLTRMAWMSSRLTSKRWEGGLQQKRQGYKRLQICCADRMRVTKDGLRSQQD